MSVTNMRSLIFAIATLSLTGNNNEFASAFTPTPSLAVTTQARSRFTDIKMADGDLDGAQITSARKELKFDDKTGRFFETDIDLDECIPEEEFCTIDEETGNKIRLTMAEKERIFLDSLQVCTRRNFLFV